MPIDDPSAAESIWPDFAAWDPPSWSALAACITATVAIIAASIAWGQIRQAIKTRRAQAQPYVAVFVEPTNVSQQFIDLIVRNMGNTAAERIKINIEPAPQRSDGAGGVEAVDYPREIKTLVPGQEWRTLWDISTARSKLDLPSRHVASVEFYGPAQKRKKFKYQYDLDWRFYIGRQWVEEYGVHHAAKALREIEKQMKKWREGIHGGLRVYVRDGDTRDEAIREERQAFEQDRARRLAEAEQSRAAASTDRQRSTPDDQDLA